MPPIRTGLLEPPVWTDVVAYVSYPELIAEAMELEGTRCLREQIGQLAALERTIGEKQKAE